MTPRAFLTPLLALLAVAVVACSDSSGTPTEPLRPGATGSAAIHGTVTGAAKSNAGISGVVVSVRGTTLQTVTDSSGRYRLDGVPGGDQALVFATDGSSSALLVEGIQPREDIALDVRVTSSGVEVARMTRSSSGGTDDAIDVAALFARLAPDHWNLNYDHSSGSVEAIIRGEGIDLIDLDSIELVGDAPDAEPLAAFASSREGDHVKARFAKSEVLDLLDDPQPGSTHLVLVRFWGSDGSGPYELSVLVTVEGDQQQGDDEPPVVDLTLEIQPKKWNTNFANSSGTVSALLRGSGFEDVDLDSIVLVGTAPGAAPLPATSASRQGNHVRARWDQSAAIGTLDTPTRGEVHTVLVQFTVDGTPYELSFDVEIVGK